VRRKRRKAKIEPRDNGVADAPIPAASAPEPELAPIAGVRKVPEPKRTQITPEAIKRWGKTPRDLIEGYRLDKLLGEGSMGAVFKAEQLSLHRAVAIKVLSPRLAENAKFLHRFMREARAVARLNHPNVVSGIDVGEAQGMRYFVMEFVEGSTLLDVIEHHDRLDSTKVTKVMLQVARALDHAHHNGLVHRDVKPANIILTKKGGRAKLCDLGLAKEVGDDGSDTLEGRAMGTPLYISQEQARGQTDIDIRSDLYSLGASFFHALTGKPPFDGPTPAVIMTKHLTEELPSAKELRPDAAPGCAIIIEKLMEKDREDRYQEPIEVIEDLEAFLEGRLEEKPKIRARRRRGRRRYR
jgi:serine/threonine-protein kinase